MMRRERQTIEWMSFAALMEDNQPNPAIFGKKNSVAYTIDYFYQDHALL
jgi:hypothetical protein